nr:MAG TPA: hypothetical protein [Caudoviricetes sp.]
MFVLRLLSRSRSIAYGILKHRPIWRHACLNMI